MKEKLAKHKKAVILIVVIIVIVVVGMLVTSNMKKKREMLMESMNQTETAFLEKRTLVSSISATGTVKSVDSKEVSVALSNVEVESLPVSVGDAVEEGDVICIFDSEDIEQNLADAKASLTATTGKSDIDVSSAERSLAEAETTRNIEAERADQNVADAWNDYLESVTDLEEAEDDWDEAIATRNEKKGEYEYRQKRLEEAKTKMENAKTSSGQSGTYETAFTDALNALKGYVADNSGEIETQNSPWDHIYLSSQDLPNMRVDDYFTFTGTTADEKQQEISGYLDSLKALQTQYQNSVAADAAYQQALSEYQALEQEVASWKTKYEAAEKEVSSYESAYEQAESASDSKLDAYDQQVENQEDSTRNNASTVASKTDNLSTARYNASVSGTSDQQKVKDYEEQLSKCTVTAPMSGVVTAVNLEEGDLYNGTAIVTIEDTSAYEISTEIDEYEIGKIREGQKVVIKTNGTGDEELDGTVKSIAPRATAGGTEVTYEVIVSIDTPNELLRMDMTAKLSIILENKENVLTVPYEAVREAEDGTYYIEVVKEDMDTQPEDGEPEKESDGAAGNTIREVKTERIAVEKGIESDYYIEVIGEALTEGMEVVVPKTDTEGMSFQEMISNRGPMGGF